MAVEYLETTKRNVANTLHGAQPKCNRGRYFDDGVGAGRYRPAPYRDSDPPDPSTGIEFFTVTDDEKSTVSPSAERPKGLSIRWFGPAMRADGSSPRFSCFFPRPRSGRSFLGALPTRPEKSDGVCAGRVELNQ